MREYGVAALAKHQSAHKRVVILDFHCSDFVTVRSSRLANQFD
jgi:hypothetical protein